MSAEPTPAPIQSPPRPGSAGPTRPSYLASTRMMAQLYMRTLLRGKKTWLVVALVVLGLGLGGLAASSTDGLHRVEGYRGMVSQLTLGFIAQFCALFYGIAVVREEVEARTLTYLLVRPLPRSSILLGRWLAALGVTVGLLVLFSLALHLVAAPPDAPLAETGMAERLLGQLLGQPDPSPPAVPALLDVLLAAALAAVYYTTAFTAIAVLLPRPLLFGLGYIIFWEFSLPLVPSSAATLSLKFHLLNLAGLQEQTGLPFLAMPEVTPAKSLVVLCIASTVLAVVSWLVFPRREYVLARSE